MLKASMANAKRQFVVSTNIQDETCLNDGYKFLRVYDKRLFGYTWRTYGIAINEP